MTPHARHLFRLKNKFVFLLVSFKSPMPFERCFLDFITGQAALDLQRCVEHRY